MVKKAEDWTGDLTTTLAGPNVSGSYGANFNFTINVNDSIQGSMEVNDRASVIAPGAGSGVYMVGGSFSFPPL